MNRINALLARIARTKLGIETLAPQGSDRLDFHEVSVDALRDALRDALEAAYRAGIEQGRKQKVAGVSGD